MGTILAGEVLSNRLASYSKSDIIVTDWLDATVTETGISSSPKRSHKA